MAARCLRAAWLLADVSPPRNARRTRVNNLGSVPEWMPGRTRAVSVSPCRPIRIGTSVRGRFAAYSRQFSFSSQTRNPNTPGTSRMMNVATV